MAVSRLRQPAANSSRPDPKETGKHQNLSLQGQVPNVQQICVTGSAFAATWGDPQRAGGSSIVLDQVS